MRAEVLNPHPAKWSPAGQIESADGRHTFFPERYLADIIRSSQVTSSRDQTFILANLKISGRLPRVQGDEFIYSPPCNKRKFLFVF